MVNADELLESFLVTGAGALILSNYPGEGSRHLLYMALARILLERNSDQQKALKFVTALYEVATEMNLDSDQPSDRAQRLGVVACTAKKIASQEPTVGWPTLAELVGTETAKEMKELLDPDALPDSYKDSPAEHSPVPAVKTQVTVLRGREIISNAKEHIWIVRGLLEMGLTLLAGPPKGRQVYAGSASGVIAYERPGVPREARRPEV